MPQVELKYSSDLSIKISDLFEEIEHCVNTLDSSSGVCKSRAYRSEEFLHSHIYLCIHLLQKPHRDQAFVKTLLDQLEKILEKHTPTKYHYACEVCFSSENYRTKKKGY